MTFLGLDQESHHLLGRADPRNQPGWCFLNLCWAEAVPIPFPQDIWGGYPALFSYPRGVMLPPFPTLESPF